MITGNGTSKAKLTHEPRFERGSIDDEIVVFIHGFMGSPRQYDNLAGAVHLQGYSYSILLLPGHGVSTREFSQSKYTDWQNHVNTEIERLSETYSKIWLVGHSMGSLLALNAAIKFPNHICGIFAIACPLKLVIFSARAIAVNFQKFFCKMSNPIKSAYIKFSGVPRGFSLMWYIHKPDFEFLKLQHKTRKILSQVKSPVSAIFSKKDEVVSMKSHDILQSGLTSCDFKSTLLYESLHAYYQKDEQAVIERELLDFIMST